MKGFTAIVDYGVGNLMSIQNAFHYLGLASEITSEPARFKKAAGILLPGVGAFPDAAQRLRESGLVDLIKDEAAQKPLLGICLGMQLLFDTSEEGRPETGLSLIPGYVAKIKTKEKLPQIGWNALNIKQSEPLFTGLSPGSHVYFVHGYHCQPTDQSVISATTDHGAEVIAAIQKGNCFGCQFHPEKSGEVGLHILKNFGALL